jgi:putative ABC transport system permease protein
MRILKLILKNSLRHKLRTFLTIVGISIAVIAFGLLRTVVTAWHAGVEASAANRLIVRQAVSFIFPLPLAYRDQISKVPGVEAVTYANWFQGVYIDKDQFFARLAVDPETIFQVYPEFVVSKDEYQNFLKERNSCIIGQDIAKQYNLMIGDLMTIEGDIYPGDWQFVVRGIYKPRDKTTDATQMLFHWDYLNEKMKEWGTGRENNVGWYIVKIKDPSKTGIISDQIDALFKNSRAETKTESERAFQQGFVQASSAIITSMNVISFVIIGIIMLVLGNTMIMSARERTREYAVFKTIGFSAGHMVGLILGESIFISAIGGGLGLFLSFPIVAGFGSAIPKGFFPVFELEPITLVFAVSSVLFIGIAASLFPIQKALRTSIVDGLRFIG